MSASTFFGPQIAAVRRPSTAAPASLGGARRLSATWNGGGVGLVIECSSRPQKKATAHHMKTRPRKTQAWDIRRKPTVYAPLPPLPPDWVLASDDGSSSDATASSSSSSAKTAPTN